MSHDGADPRIELAMQLVLAHLARHPSAADTLEGIAQWWLGPDDPAIPHAVLQVALERLEAQGVLQCRRLARNRVLWSAAQSPNP